MRSNASDDETTPFYGVNVDHRVGGSAGVSTPTFDEKKRPWKRIWSFIIVLAVVLIVVAIVVPIVVTRKTRPGPGSSQQSSTNSQTTAIDMQPTSALSQPSGTASQSGGEVLSTADSSPTGGLPLNPDDDPFEVPVPVLADEPNSVIMGSRLTSLGDIRNDGGQALLFQAGNGSIRYVLIPSVSGLGEIPSEGDFLPIDDAMPGTPLTAGAVLRPDRKADWTVWYVDKSNTIQSYIRANESDAVWTVGSIGERDYKVPGHPNVAFFNAPGRSADAASLYGSGASLYATGPDNHVHEYEWNDTTNSWTDFHTFEESDGSAGAAMNWLKGGSAFIASTGGSSLQLWYRKWFDSMTSEWATGPKSPDQYNVRDNSAVCIAFGYFAYQTSSSAIRVGRFDVGVDTADWKWGQSNVAASADEKPLNGTSLSCTYRGWNVGDKLFAVQYQTESGDIKEASIGSGKDITDYAAWKQQTILSHDF